MLNLDERFYNRAKHLLKEKKKLLGAWLQTGSPMAAEIFGKSGLDVVVIDMEHGPGDIMNLIDQLRGLGRFQTTPLVRAPWNDMVWIKKILDAGAYGVLVPYVNTKEEAEAAVAACRYPLKGVRGVAGSPRAPGWGQNIGNYMDVANDEVLVMIAIETETAVNNIEEILSVEGLDGIFIGPMDLSCSMGHFRDPSHPEVQAAIKKVEDAVNKSDKFLASIAAGAEAAQEKYDKGYNLIMAFADGGTLASVSRRNVEIFRSLNG